MDSCTPEPDRMLALRMLREIAQAKNVDAHERIRACELLLYFRAREQEDAREKGGGWWQMRTIRPR